MTIVSFFFCMLQTCSVSTLSQVWVQVECLWFEYEYTAFAWVEYKILYYPQYITSKICEYEYECKFILTVRVQTTVQNREYKYYSLQVWCVVLK